VGKLSSRGEGRRRSKRWWESFKIGNNERVTLEERTDRSKVYCERGGNGAIIKGRLELGIGEAYAGRTETIGKGQRRIKLL